MSIVVNVNGESINYPQTGDTNWGDEATDFAVQTSSAFAKVGLSTGTTVDLPGTLDVTGNTTLDANLSVGGNAAISGNGTIGGTLGVTGDVAINTNKFNITASSGNTIIAGTLGISNGTELAPAITPSGDTNTGLYSISADKIGFSANGVRQGEFGVGYGGFTGNVIQVVQTVKTNTYQCTNTSFEDATGMSVTITPKYSTSKILVTGYFSAYVNQNTYNFGLRVVRGTSTVISGNTNTYGDIMLSGLGGSRLGSQVYEYLDSPNTTSATTYKLQCKVESASYPGWINDMNGFTATSTITVMEIQQ